MPRSAPPRFGTPATDRDTFGAAVVAAADALGPALMPWQRLVVDVGLEHEQGRLAYRDVVVTTPRQSGKSTLVLATLVARMLAAPDQRIAYAAQTRLAARTKLFDTWWPRLRRSPLGELFTMTRATGAETLRARNGSLLGLLSTEAAAGHGETLDLAVLDECWALDDAAEQAVRPALATRPNGQLWTLSTAGSLTSAYWRSRVEAAGRQPNLALPPAPRSSNGPPPTTSTSPTGTPGPRSCQPSATPSTPTPSRQTWPRCCRPMGPRLRQPLAQPSRRGLASHPPGHLGSRRLDREQA